MSRLERGGGFWHGAPMARRNSLAGGFFLVAAILTGAVWGIFTGKAMIGIVAGTAIGIAAAISVWMVDRRRRP